MPLPRVSGGAGAVFTTASGTGLSFFYFRSYILVVLTLTAEVQIRVFRRHGGPVEILTPGQHIPCGWAEFPTLFAALQLSPHLPAVLLQSPPVPRGAELWHEWPPPAALNSSLLGMQLGALGIYCLPTELATLLEVNPLWQAPASLGRDALPALQEDLHLLDCPADPHPRSASQPEMVLQGVVITVMGKHKLNHSWGGRSLPPPPANQNKFV